MNKYMLVNKWHGTGRRGPVDLGQSKARQNDS